MGSFDIAILFAGAARSSPIDGLLTLGAEAAATAARILDARLTIPAHQDGWAHFSQGPDELAHAFARAGLGDRLLPAPPGATLALHFDATNRQLSASSTH